MKREMMLKPIGLCALLAAALLLGGCGTPAEAPQMGLNAGEALQLRTWVPDALKAQITVGPVTGGQPTGKYWGAKVSNEALQEAVEDSLRATGMLAARPGSGRYALQVQLVSLEQPMVALNMKVTATLAYTLIDKTADKGAAALYQRRLRTVHTTEFTEALIDQNERQRIASENAIRKGVLTVVRELIELRLP
jgi:hypothetical protein